MASELIGACLIEQISVVGRTYDKARHGARRKLVVEQDHVGGLWAAEWSNGMPGDGWTVAFDVGHSPEHALQGLLRRLTDETKQDDAERKGRR